MRHLSTQYTFNSIKTDYEKSQQQSRYETPLTYNHKQSSFTSVTDKNNVFTSAKLFSLIHHLIKAQQQIFQKYSCNYYTNICRRKTVYIRYSAVTLSKTLFRILPNIYDRAFYKNVNGFKAPNLDA